MFLNAGLKLEKDLNISSTAALHAVWRTVLFVGETLHMWSLKLWKIIEAAVGMTASRDAAINLCGP